MMTDRESRDQPAVSTGQPVIGVLRRPDEIMLDLDSPETITQALRLTMQHASGKGVDAGDSEAPVAVGGMRNPNSSEDNASTENGSLPPLVPVMIEVPPVSAADRAEGPLS